MIGFLILRPKAEEPEVVAEKFLHAGLSGDADTLLYYQHDHEKRLLKLSRKQVQDILYYVNSVLLRGSKSIGEATRQPVGPGHGVAYISISNGSTHSKFEIISDRTEAGPKACISHIVLMALSVRAVLDGKSAEDIDWRVHKTAVADVMAAHKGELEKLGISGYVSNDPDGNIVTFATYIRTRGGAAMKL